MLNIKTTTSKSAHEIAESQGSLTNSTGRIRPIPMFDLSKSTIATSMIFNIEFTFF